MKKPVDNSNASRGLAIILERMESQFKIFGEDLVSIKTDVRILKEEAGRQRETISWLKIKIDSMDKRMDRIETRMDRMETKMDSMETKIDSMETKIDSINTDIAEIKIGVKDQNRRIVKLEETVAE